MTAKERIAQMMAEVRKHAKRYGDIHALWHIGTCYKYAESPEEKAAWHIIISHLRQNPEAAPYLPELPKIEMSNA